MVWGPRGAPFLKVRNLRGIGTRKRVEDHLEAVAFELGLAV